MNALDQYQAEAAVTAIYPARSAIIYPALGLSEEAGEVAGKISKWIRDAGGQPEKLDKEAVAKELGDVLWFVSNLAYDLGYTLSDIAYMNIKKLQDRAARGKLTGSGDNR